MGKRHWREPVDFYSSGHTVQIMKSDKKRWVRLSIARSNTGQSGNDESRCDRTGSRWVGGVPSDNGWILPLFVALDLDLEFPVVGL